MEVNGVGVNGDLSLEHEADLMGQRALQKKPTMRVSVPQPTIQRTGDISMGKTHPARKKEDLIRRTSIQSMQLKNILNVASGSNEENMLKARTDAQGTTVTNLESGHMLIASLFDLIPDQTTKEKVFNKLNITKKGDIATKINEFLAGIKDREDMRRKVKELEKAVSEVGFPDLGMSSIFNAEMLYLEEPEYMG